MKTTMYSLHKNAMLRERFRITRRIDNWNRLTSEILANGSIILNAPDYRYYEYDSLIYQLS